MIGNGFLHSHSLPFPNSGETIIINHFCQVWMQISWKRLEREVRLQWNTNRKWHRRIDWSRDRWRHVTVKGQGRDPHMFGVHYLENGLRQRLGYNKAFIGNGNGKEWESPCVGMGMALFPMGINSHRQMRYLAYVIGHSSVGLQFIIACNINYKYRYTQTHKHTASDFIFCPMQCIALDRQKAQNSSTKTKLQRSVQRSSHVVSHNMKSVLLDVQERQRLRNLILHCLNTILSHIFMVTWTVLRSTRLFISRLQPAKFPSSELFQECA